MVYGYEYVSFEFSFSLMIHRDQKHALLTVQMSEPEKIGFIHGIISDGICPEEPEFPTVPQDLTSRSPGY